MQSRSPPARARQSPGSARVAWLLFGLTLALFIPGVALAATQSLWEFGLPNLIWALSILAYAATGALILAHRPGNRIGWFLSIGALLISIGLMGVEYATRSVTSDAVWPGHRYAGWTGLVLTLSGLMLLFPATFLHFPDGRLPSEGWRWVRRILALAAGLTLAVMAFAPGVLMLGQLRLVGDTSNPFGLESALLDSLRPFSLPLLFVILAVAFAAPYVRLRRATGVERQQLKWFVYATALVAVAQVAIAVVSALRPGEDAGEVAVNFLTALGFFAVPVAVGIAVLRHRLYDIDLVIRRTLVYGILTLLLAGVYAAGAVLVPVLISSDSDNEVLVAASTLAVVFLFAPLRRRVQELVDRRFFRTKYDAREAVAAFSAEMSQGTEPDELREELEELVVRSLQPASIGVWIKHEP